MKNKQKKKAAPTLPQLNNGKLTEENIGDSLKILSELIQNPALMGVETEVLFGQQPYLKTWYFAKFQHMNPHHADALCEFIVVCYKSVEKNNGGAMDMIKQTDLMEMQEHYREFFINGKGCFDLKLHEKFPESKVLEYAIEVMADPMYEIQGPDDVVTSILAIGHVICQQVR
ncbi:MAG: hypothetical protein MK132_04160 [Lentisphaerales bacterium]|nr:hypothetical protein [Lentisphaerales bacterium]